MVNEKMELICSKKRIECFDYINGIQTKNIRKYNLIILLDFRKSLFPLIKWKTILNDDQSSKT
jgi:hypothetical protein